MRNAQAAMEFLMTYGWAIAVLLITVGVLSYYGVLQMPITEKCVLPPGNGIHCMDINIQAETSVSFRIRNALPNSVTILAASNINENGNACTLGADIEIQKNYEGVLTFSSGGTCGILLSPHKMKANLNLVYTSGGFQRETEGTVQARIV